MKTVLMCLLFFGTFVLFSSAFLPNGAPHDDHYDLLGTANRRDTDNNELQRRKPPAKIPGPKLTEEQIVKYLHDGDKGKKEKKHLRADGHKKDSKGKKESELLREFEENQQEKTTIF